MGGRENGRKIAQRGRERAITKARGERERKKKRVFVFQKGHEVFGGRGLVLRMENLRSRKPSLRSCYEIRSRGRHRGDGCKENGDMEGIQT